MCFFHCSSLFGARIVKFARPAQVACTRICARAPVRSALGSVISEILGKFQAGEGGGIFHAGAAVPARLTPPRLPSAAGGAEAPGFCRPASRRLQTVRDVPEVWGTVPS